MGGQGLHGHPSWRNLSTRSLKKKTTTIFPKKEDSFSASLSKYRNSYHESLQFPNCTLYCGLEGSFLAKIPYLCGKICYQYQLISYVCVLSQFRRMTNPTICLQNEN